MKYVASFTDSKENVYCIWKGIVNREGMVALFIQLTNSRGFKKKMLQSGVFQFLFFNNHEPAPGGSKPNLLDDAVTVYRLLDLGVSTAEINVLRIKVTGLSNKSAAAQIFVSLGTLKKHLTNMYSRYEVNSFAGLCIALHV